MFDEDLQDDWPFEESPIVFLDDGDVVAYEVADHEGEPWLLWDLVN